MAMIALKLTVAVATGFVGGYVHHNLGAQWGIPMLAGVGLGFWLGGYFEA